MRGGRNFQRGRQVPRHLLHERLALFLGERQ